jgi:hypothetical protein
MQKHIAEAWDGTTATVTRTPEQWKANQKKVNEPEAKEAEVLKGQLHVTVEEKTIAGVHVYRVTPDNRTAIGCWSMYTVEPMSFLAGWPPRGRPYSWRTTPRPR